MRYERLLGHTENAYLAEDVLKKINLETKGLSKKLRESIKLFVNTELEKLSTAKKVFETQLANELKRRFKNIGLTIQGNYPSFTAGFYKIKVEPRSGDVAIFFGEELLTKVKLNPELITTELEKFIQMIERRSFKEAEFYNLLRTAYKRWLMFNNKSFGEPAPILDVLDELVMLIQPSNWKRNPIQEHFKSYSRILFGYDLYRLLQSSKSKNIKLEPGEKSDRKHSIYVPQDKSKGTWYSFISF